MTVPIDDNLAQYMSCGDPDLKDYYPGWLKDIADDATVVGTPIAEHFRSSASGQMK